MPKRSFDTGWPCPWYYDADNQPCEPTAPGAQPCMGWIDADDKPCDESAPSARQVRGVMDVPEDDPYCDTLKEKRRKRRCVFCKGTEKTKETSLGPSDPGQPGRYILDASGIYGLEVDNRPRLFPIEDYVSPSS